MEFDCLGHVLFELGIIILDKVMIFAGGSVYIGLQLCVDIVIVLMMIIFCVKLVLMKL